MTIIQTQNLTGAALDWAVAHAGAWQHAHTHFPTMTLDPTFKGCEVFRFEGGRVVCRLVPNNPFRQDYVIYQPSTDWALGGPIIEREHIEVAPTYADDGKTVEGWMAIMFNDERCGHQAIMQDGPTPLIAAMRCYVASKLGDPVDVPKELAS